MSSMESLRTRLVACFMAVFPGLTPEEASSATVDTIPAWDSSHHFMLMEVIEESFGIRFPEEVLGEIESFRGFEEYLSDKAG